MKLKKKRWHCLPGVPITELDKQVMYWENKVGKCYARSYKDPRTN